MNIAQIAEMAGVSRAAVSRYFNNGYISDEKRERIRKAVEETGYKPSVQAQTLRTRKTRMVGIIAPKVASYSTGKVVEGLLSVLDKHDYHTMLAVTQNDSKQELEYLRTFDSKRVDGVILIGTIFSAEHRKLLRMLEVPVVVVGQLFEGYCSVYHDDFHAIYEVTKRMIDKGRKHIAFIGANLQDRAAGYERLNGYQTAVRDAGMNEREQIFTIADFSVTSGYKHVQEILEKDSRLDGLVCATDEIAVGAMQYLLEKNYHIPEEVMIAGLGDSILARVAGHHLMTAHLAYEKSGSIAADMLLELMDTGETAIKEIKLGYTIVDIEHL